MPQAARRRMAASGTAAMGREPDLGDGDSAIIDANLLGGHAPSRCG